MTDVSDFSEFRIEDILLSLSSSLSVQLFFFSLLRCPVELLLSAATTTYMLDVEYLNRYSTSCSFDLGLCWKLRVLAPWRAFLAVTTMPLTALASRCTSHLRSGENGLSHEPAYHEGYGASEFHRYLC